LSVSSGESSLSRRPFRLSQMSVVRLTRMARNWTNLTKSLAWRNVSSSINAGTDDMFSPCPDIEKYFQGMSFQGRRLRRCLKLPPERPVIASDRLPGHFSLNSLQRHFKTHVSMPFNPICHKQLRDRLF